jgi:hypothetical protein
MNYTDQHGHFRSTEDFRKNFQFAFYIKNTSSGSLLDLKQIAPYISVKVEQVKSNKRDKLTKELTMEKCGTNSFKATDLEVYFIVLIDF